MREVRDARVDAVADTEDEAELEDLGIDQAELKRRKFGHKAGAIRKDALNALSSIACHQPLGADRPGMLSRKANAPGSGSGAGAEGAGAHGHEEDSDSEPSGALEDRAAGGAGSRSKKNR